MLDVGLDRTRSKEPQATGVLETFEQALMPTQVLVQHHGVPERLDPRRIDEQAEGGGLRPSPGGTCCGGLPEQAMTEGVWSDSDARSMEGVSPG
jgi:hypothetical protein